MQLMKTVSLLIFFGLCTRPSMAAQFCATISNTSTLQEIGCFATVEKAMAEASSRCINCQIYLDVLKLTRTDALDAHRQKAYLQSVMMAAEYLTGLGKTSYLSSATITDFLSPARKHLEAIKPVNVPAISKWLSKAKGAQLEASSQSAMNALVKIKSLCVEANQFLSTSGNFPDRTVSFENAKAFAERAASDSLTLSKNVGNFVASTRSLTQQNIPTHIEKLLSQLSTTEELEALGTFSFHNTTQLRNIYDNLRTSEAVSNDIQNELSAFSADLIALNQERHIYSEALNNYSSELASLLSKLRLWSSLDDLLDLEATNFERSQWILDGIDNLARRAQSLVIRTPNQSDTLKPFVVSFLETLDKMARSVTQHHDRASELLANSVSILSVNKENGNDGEL